MKSVTSTVAKFRLDLVEALKVKRNKDGIEPADDYIFYMGKEKIIRDSTSD
jgi:hypothetical protein